MNAPRLNEYNCSVLVAEYATGEVFKADLTLFLKGDDESKVFRCFDTFLKAKHFVLDLVQNKPEFECVIFNHHGEHLVTYDHNGRRSFATTEFWIEKAWGDQVDNATMDDVKVAILEVISMDEEHGAFWVGNYERESVLEVHRNMEVLYVPDTNLDEQLNAKLNSWQEVAYLFEQFLNNNHLQIQSFIISRKNEGPN